jgi:hypothetical protein
LHQIKTEYENAPLKYDRFSVYGFAIDYPSTYAINFNKAEHDKGEISFLSPKGDKVAMSWGKLEKMQKRYGSVEEEAQEGVRRLKKSKDISNFEIVEHKITRINNHDSVFDHVSFTHHRIVFPLVTRRAEEFQVRSLHLQCEQSSRFFVVYGMVDSNRSSELGSIFQNMIESFACH